MLEPALLQIPFFVPATCPDARVVNKLTATLIDYFTSVCAHVFVYLCLDPLADSTKGVLHVHVSISGELLLSSLVDIKAPALACTCYDTELMTNGGCLHQ